MTQRSGAPSSSRTRSTSSWASRSWMTRVLSSRLARSMCRRKLSSCTARPSSPGAEVVEAGLPHGPHLVVGAGQPLDLGHRRVEVARPGAPRWGAARPRRPAPACSAAASTAHRAPGRSQPICTMRATLTAVARSMAARVSSQSPSAMSRWQWLSTTGSGSGSGAGGRSRSRRARRLLGGGAGARWAGRTLVGHGRATGVSRWTSVVDLALGHARPGGRRRRSPPCGWPRRPPPRPRRPAATSGSLADLGGRHGAPRRRW